MGEINNKVLIFKPKTEQNNEKKESVKKPSPVSESEAVINLEDRKKIQEIQKKLEEFKERFQEIFVQQTKSELVGQELENVIGQMVFDLETFEEKIEPMINELIKKCGKTSDLISETEKNKGILAAEKEHGPKLDRELNSIEKILSLRIEVNELKEKTVDLLAY